MMTDQPALVTVKRLLALALLALQLLGSDCRASDDGERRRLAGEQARISERIDELKREQEYLLFEKVLSGTDSKYLVLDLATGVCRLKYRNRTLRSFEVTIQPSLREGLRKGVYVLTRKDDGSPAGRALVFQEELVLHGKKYSVNGTGGTRLPGITVGKRDLAAVFFAVEGGSRLYIR